MIALFTALLVLIPSFATSENSKEHFDLANFRGAPSATVGGHVNVITGDFTDHEVDFVSPGGQSEPFVLDRVYSSSQLENGTLSTSWNINFNHSAKYMRKVTERNYHDKAILAKNYFLVADGKGAILKYRGLHGHVHPNGGYRIQDKLWKKGLTNLTGDGISGQTNVKNSEAWINTRTATLRLANNDVLDFKAVRKQLEDPNRIVPTDLEIAYIPTKKTKRNRTVEVYCFDEGNDITLRKVNLYGSSGQRINMVGFVNGRESIYVDAMYGSPVRYDFQRIRHLGQERLFLHKVKRKYAPNLRYDYERYETEYDKKKAARIIKKSYPEGRFVQADYYDRGRSYVHGREVYFKDRGDNRYSRVKRLLRPLAPNGESAEEYSFVYNVKCKEGQLEGSAHVFDAHGVLKIYHFSKSRLNNVKSFYTYKGVKNSSIYRSEVFLWGDGKHGCPEGFYAGRIVGDLVGGVVGTFLEYDSFGNISKETLSGTLTGVKECLFRSKADTLAKGAECYSKQMFHSQDGSNLLIEEFDFRKKILYRYLEGTNLVSARFESDHEKIRKREFFFYDENGFKTGEIQDDGETEDPDSLTGVTERHVVEYRLTNSYPFGLPAEVVFRSLDLETGQLCQLKRIKNSFSDQGRLLKEDLYDSQDAYVSTKEWRYNGFGQVVFEKNAEGEVVERSYDANGNLTEEIGPLPGYSKRYTYDFCNRLIKEEEILADAGVVLAKNYRYNLKSERIEESDFSGNVTRYEYDELGRCIAATVPSFFTESGTAVVQTKTMYDVMDNPITQIDAKGGVTECKYTARGKPYYKKNADGTEERTYFDLDGTLRESVDIYGNKTVIESDYLGRPTKKSVYSPAGELLKANTYTYNAFHLLKETDPNGCETRFFYDYAGRLVRKERGSSIEEYAYDNLSRPYKTTVWTEEGEAIVKVCVYDLKDRVIEERMETLDGVVQSRICTEYNALDKKLRERVWVDDREAVTCYKYNSRGDLIETTNAEGFITRIEYDFSYVDDKGERGIRVSTIDPKGLLTIVDKNPLGLEKRIEKRNSLGETLQLSEIFYNCYGEKVKRQETVFFQGKALKKIATAWGYDSCGRLTHLIEAQGSNDEKIICIDYNSKGQKVAVTRSSGRKILYEYDTLGRLSRWFADDQTFDYHYRYDAMDNPVTVFDALYQTTMHKTFDLQNRQVAEEQPSGIVRYAYDGAGRVVCLTLPDNSSVEYSYEGTLIRAIRRFSSSGEESYRFEVNSYDGRGKLTSCRLPLDAGEITCSYDLMGRTRSIVSSHYREELSAYDEAGNLLNRTFEDRYGSVKESFLYDELDQLIEEKGAVCRSYVFDSLHNRVEEDGSINSINDLNQILERKDRSYRYDLDGNLIELIKPDAVYRFSYDAAGRMTSFTDGIETVSYRYDEQHRRTHKLHAGGVTRYLYQGQNELGSLDGAYELRILSGLGLGAEIGSAIAIEREAKILVPIHDHIGNITCLVDASTREIAYSARYGAFGNILEESGDKSSWGFSSKRLDRETGLIFFGRRYYDPESGRFITKDPLGDREGPNLYAYVANNPLMFVDLYGLYAAGAGSFDD
ncbi:RHS repeat-associated core domain-containing protein, partial [Estrella lausannensis]|uniref:RHS repeat-associated core domain-containing protein n=1 Tax=Estrella lausannensis TaxID=483423 RepID=UPI00117B1270